MRIAVLTYHSTNIAGNEYSRNDHVALADDLAFLRARSYLFLSARQLVDILRAGRIPHRVRGRRAVVLTCDDGADYDFHSLIHETQGPQTSFHDALQQASRWHERLPGFPRRLQRPHITAFVIVSPDARTRLDRTCLAGAGRWNDDWWSSAVASGVMDIGNHSWDHLHPTLPAVAQRDQQKGSFHYVDSWDDADRQIRQARDYLTDVAPNPGDRLFAYPYGDVNNYLANEYFPRHEPEHGALGAFTTEPTYVYPGTDPYRIPRFVCGEHWASSRELRELVEASSF